MVIQGTAAAFRPAEIKGEIDVTTDRTVANGLQNRSTGAPTGHLTAIAGVRYGEECPAEESLSTDEQYTMFHPSEVELATTGF